MYKIVRREAFSATTYISEVGIAAVTRSVAPGYYVMMRLREGRGRIPRPRSGKADLR